MKLTRRTAFAGAGALGVVSVAGAMPATALPKPWRAMPVWRELPWVRCAGVDELVGPFITVFRIEPRDAAIGFSLEERAA